MRRFCAILLLVATALAIEECKDWYMDAAVNDGDYWGYQVTRMDVLLLPGSPYTWQQVLADKLKVISTEHPYLYCNFTAGGSTPYQGPCIIKMQGDASRTAPEPSFKIKFTDKKWRHQDTVNFKKVWDDPTRLREKLTEDLMRQTPNLVSYMGQFTRLYINGTDYGFYSMVENTDKNYIDNRRLPKGELYKLQGTFNFGLPDLVSTLLPQTDPNYNKTLFELELGIEGYTTDNHTRLIDMVRQVNNASWTNQGLLNTYFDVPNMCAFIGVEVLSNNIMNTAGRNYLIYAPNTDDGSSRWAFMPWDFDSGFGYYTHQADILKTVPVPPKYFSGIGELWYNPVLTKLFLTPEYVALMNITVNRMHNTVWNSAWLANVTSQLSGPVSSNIFGSVDKTSYYSNMGGTADYRQSLFPGEIQNLVAQPEINFNDYLNGLWEPRSPYIGLTTFSSDGSLHSVTWTQFAHMFGCEVMAEVLMYERPQDATGVYRTDYTFNSNITAGAKPPILNATMLGSQTGIQIASADFYKPNTTYFVRLIHRAYGRTPELDWSQQMGSQWNDAVNKVSYKGVNWFASPLSMGAAPPLTPATLGITSLTANGVMYNVIGGGTNCNNLAFTLPDGWFLAPHDATTTADLKSLANTFGSAAGLILRDGTVVSPTTGAQIATGYLRAIVRKAGVGYTSNACSYKILVVSMWRQNTPSCPNYDVVKQYEAQIGDNLSFAGALPDPNARGTCKPPKIETCADLDPFDFGTVTFSADNKTVYYTCDAGYTLTGPRQRSCSNGTWVGDAPSCAKTITPVTGGGNGNSGGQASGGPKGGFSASASSGSSSATTDATACPQLTTPDHGTMQIIGADAYFTCNDGYTLTGEDTLYCQSNTWNGAAPTCVSNSASTTSSTTGGDTVKGGVTVVSSGETSLPYAHLVVALAACAGGLFYLMK